MQRHGWTLLFHDCLLRQLERLSLACNRAKAANPSDWEANANVKLFHALSRLMLDTIPADPGHPAYRQGTTLGKDYRHWRRAKIGRRFRIFFRYDSSTKIIIYAWVNDEKTYAKLTAKQTPMLCSEKCSTKAIRPTPGINF